MAKTKNEGGWVAGRFIRDAKEYQKAYDEAAAEGQKRLDEVRASAPLVRAAAPGVPDRRRRERGTTDRKRGVGTP